VSYDGHSNHNEAFRRLLIFPAKSTMRGIPEDSVLYKSMGIVKLRRKATYSQKDCRKMENQSKQLHLQL
jgi:hypothetical protein